MDQEKNNSDAQKELAAKNLRVALILSGISLTIYVIYLLSFFL